jgi:hypothetical protein
MTTTTTPTFRTVTEADVAPRIAYFTDEAEAAERRHNLPLARLYRAAAVRTQCRVGHLERIA